MKGTVCIRHLAFCGQILMASFFSSGQLRNKPHLLQYLMSGYYYKGSEENPSIHTHTITPLSLACVCVSVVCLQEFPCLCVQLGDQIILNAILSCFQLNLLRQACLPSTECNDSASLTSQLALKTVSLLGAGITGGRGDIRLYYARALHTEPAP